MQMLSSDGLRRWGKDVEGGMDAFTQAVFAGGGFIDSEDGDFQGRDARVGVPGDGFEDISSGTGVVLIGESGLLSALEFDDPFYGSLGRVVGLIVRICVIVIRFCDGLASDADVEQLEGEDAYQGLT